MLGGVIRGKRVTLRTPREADPLSIDRWMADMSVRRTGQIWAEPATPATWKERLAEAAKDQRSVVWSIDAGGALVGFARVSFGHDDPRHLDVDQLVIDPSRWGQGLGTDAALALHRFWFDYLNGSSAAFEAAADNARGLRVAEKIGYREFGRGHDVYYRDGRYTDQVFLHLERTTWDERWPREREYAPFPEGITR